jgi:pyridoxamine 5'-phosphate oxidase
MTQIPSVDPYTLFATWLHEAEQSEPNDANALTLATADRQGRPSARMVLLKGFDAQGFVFYTNLASRKGEELAQNPAVHLLFHWKSLKRQVRIDGVASLVDDAEADAYFASRPRVSQIGAWASDQSRVLDNRDSLMARVAYYTAQFASSPTIPRPAHWSGWRVVPHAIEFWQDQEFRLHERCVYNKTAQGWQTTLLYP